MPIKDLPDKDGSGNKDTQTSDGDKDHGMHTWICVAQESESICRSLFWFCLVMTKWREDYNFEILFQNLYEIFFLGNKGE